MASRKIYSLQTINLIIMSEHLSFSPTTPPRLHVEPLPPATYLAQVESGLGNRGQQVAVLTAWLRDGWAVTDVEGSESAEEFIVNHCGGCDYYCDTETFDGQGETIEDGEGVEWRITSACCESPCPCHADGIDYVDFPCLMGHDAPGESNDDESVVLAGMTFTAYRELDPRAPYALQTPDQDGIAAELCKAECIDGVWRSTDALRSINCYEDGGVCWGRDNDVPASLADAADTYATAGGNNDLLDTASFLHNNQRARNAAVPNTVFESGHRLSGLLLPIEQQGREQALVVASAAINPQAFLLLTASGCAQTNGLVAAIAFWSATHNGWIIHTGVADHHWLIGISPTEQEANEGILLGQLHITDINPPSPSCDSHEPSSSAPAALAAS